MSKVVGDYRLWVRLFFATIVTSVAAGCADPATTWRVVVTRIDPITASKISSAVSEQLLNRHIADLIVTDARPANHTLEVRVITVHRAREYGLSTDMTAPPRSSIDRLSSKATVWSGAQVQFGAEQSFVSSVSDSSTSTDPTYDAVAALANQIGEMLASIEPKVD